MTGESHMGVFCDSTKVRRNADPIAQPPMVRDKPAVGRLPGHARGRRDRQGSVCGHACPFPIAGVVSLSHTSPP